MKKIFTIILFSAFALVSCSLDEDPKTQLSETTIFSTEAGLEAAVVGCYNSFKAEDLWQGRLAEYLQCGSIVTHWKGNRVLESWLQGLQRDRRVNKGFLTPGGPQLELMAGKWNVFIRNRLYWGSGLMPLYDSVDNAGVKYGSNLYWGSPFYMVHRDRNESWKHWGTYDRLEIFWAPKISKYLDLKVSTVFHFNEWEFSGWQQKLTLAFIFGN